MKFNLQKNNTRNLIDINDFRAWVLMISSTINFLDQATLAVIVETLDYISKAFDTQRPREKEILDITINDYSLREAVNKTYKKNYKLSKKKKTLELEDITPPPNPEDMVFNNKQKNQITELLKPEFKELQTTLQASLLEVTKKILSSIEKPVEKQKTKKSEVKENKE